MTTYRIESTMRPTAKGGDWSGPWALHTSLDGKNLSEARQHFRRLRDGFEPAVRGNFRLVSVHCRRRVIAA